MNLTGSRKEKPIGVRLPPGLRERLKAAAAANGRSQNSEIVVRLADSLGIKREPDAPHDNTD